LRQHSPRYARASRGRNGGHEPQKVGSGPNNEGNANGNDRHRGTLGEIRRTRIRYDGFASQLTQLYGTAGKLTIISATNDRDGLFTTAGQRHVMNYVQLSAAMATTRMSVDDVRAPVPDEN